MLINTYKKINVSIPKKQFSMPLSLRYIKELAAASVTGYNSLHIIDLTSLVYSLRIDLARQKLEMDRQRKLAERGIREVRTATEADFDLL